VAKLPYLLVDAFTEMPGGGNRVALVLDARGMLDEEMRRAVALMKQPQAAFVTDYQERFFEVRFYTPTGEVEFAGHALVALGLTLVREGRVPEGTSKFFLRTPVETLPVEIRYREGVPVQAEVRGPAPRFRDPPPWRFVQRFLDALGGNERYIHRGLPHGVAFTGLWSLFLPLVAPGLVDALEPQMEELAELCRELEVATVHTYAPMGPRSFYARDFAPRLGIPEDPVTGSANAALGSLLARAGVVPRWEEEVRLTILQGHHLGQPGVVEVRVDYGPAGNILAVYLAGSAVLVESRLLEL